MPNVPHLDHGVYRNHQRDGGHNPPAGFTLIEVLVVVGIIALLIAITVPAMARSREQARTVACRTNLSQLGKGLLMYAQNYGGTLPYEDRGEEISHGRICWYDAMDRFLTRGKLDKRAKIWWDLRPHPVYTTLEFRISDICTNVDDCICIAALFQAICAKLLKLRKQNMSWRQYRHAHITENKWRAVRYGIDGELIDFGIESAVPFPQLMGELLELLNDVVDELDSRNEVEHVYNILRDGTSADRQLRVYHEHGGDDNREEALRAVVDYLVTETKKGVI